MKTMIRISVLSLLLMGLNNPIQAKCIRNVEPTIESLSQDNWIETLAVSSDNTKRIKVKYKLNMFNEIDTFAGFKIWFNNNWTSALGYKDQYGRIYISHYGVNYYL